MNLLFQALSAHAAANATGEIPGASIVPANPADPQQNTAYSVQFSVTGATGPFTWSRINTIVPAGLSYTNTAGNTYTLAGSTTANVGATFPQTLRATRSDGRFVEAQFDLTIQAGAVPTLTWTMTAGSQPGQAGYFAGTFGSISQEPLSGFTMQQQVYSTQFNFDTLVFNGNAVSALSGYTTLTVNGTNYALGTPTFSSSNNTTSVPTTGTPVYASGTTYNCSLS